MSETKPTYPPLDAAAFRRLSRLRKHRRGETRWIASDEVTPLRALRAASGLTLAETAWRTGISSKTLAGYEHGPREPGARATRLLAAFYGVSCDEILGYESSEER